MIFRNGCFGGGDASEILEVEQMTRKAVWVAYSVQFRLNLYWICGSKLAFIQHNQKKWQLLYRYELWKYFQVYVFVDFLWCRAVKTKYWPRRPKKNCMKKYYSSWVLTHVRYFSLTDVKYKTILLVSLYIFLFSFPSTNKVQIRLSVIASPFSIRCIKDSKAQCRRRWILGITTFFRNEKTVGPFSTLVSCCRGTRKHDGETLWRAHNWLEIER